MKFVYVLISKEKDYFPEQTYVSMYSLKKNNPDAHITLVSDVETLNSLEGNRGRLKELVDEFISAPLPEGLTPVQKNRFLKTSVRQLVDGTFLYLDNDTVITGDLSDLEKLECDFGGILDHHVELDVRTHKQLQKYLKTTGKKFWGYNKFFNGGVFFVKDTHQTRQLFETWHTLWNEERTRYGINIDQASYAQANVINGCMIEEISGVYNCQLPTPGALNYLFDAKIVHYYANSPFASQFPLCKESVLQKIREQGINPEIEEIVNYPQASYLDSCRIIGGDELQKKYYSPFMMLSRKIERLFPFLNPSLMWVRNLIRGKEK